MCGSMGGGASLRRSWERTHKLFLLRAVAVEERSKGLRDACCGLLAERVHTRKSREVAIALREATRTSRRWCYGDATVVHQHSEQSGCVSEGAAGKFRANSFGALTEARTLLASFVLRHSTWR